MSLFPPLNKQLKQISNYHSDIQYSYHSEEGGNSIIIQQEQKEPIVSDSQFKYVIQEKYERMVKDKHENPTLIIPNNFKKFITGEEFLRFLKKIYEYCCDINIIEKKRKYLEEEAKQRQKLPPQFLYQEKLGIQDKAKDICLMYSLIILKWGKLKVINRDQNFFETMIYFITQNLKEFFSREDYHLIEEEINRLFRTNIFNIIKRRHLEDQRYQQYPVLKQNSQKEPIENVLTNLQKRSQIPRYKVNKEMGKEQSDIKPFFLKNSPCGSVNTRSPLISLLFPSKKESLFKLNQERQNRNCNLQNDRSFNTYQISDLIKKEKENFEKKKKKTALDIKLRSISLYN